MSEKQKRQSLKGMTPKQKKARKAEQDKARRQRLKEPAKIAAAIDKALGHRTVGEAERAFVPGALAGMAAPDAAAQAAQQEEWERQERRNRRIEQEAQAHRINAVESTVHSLANSLASKGRAVIIVL